MPYIEAAGLTRANTHFQPDQDTGMAAFLEAEGFDPSSLLLGISQKSRGVVSDNLATGQLARIAYPEAAEGVYLGANALCATRAYPNDGSRVRITDRHIPDVIVERGARVVALVQGLYYETGRDVPNPFRRINGRTNWDAPAFIPERTLVAAHAVRWGLDLSRPNTQA